MGQQLNALDIAFLGLETQRTPVNVAALQVLEIPEGYKGNFVRDLLDELAKHPPGPPFDRKLGRGPIVGVPYWVVDDHFDLDYHVRHSALPKPGTMEELLSLVSRLHSRVLDRERPLWEFHVIEGLRNRRFAIYMKMHHAAIDGMGGIAMLEACYGTSPDAPVRGPWRGLGKKGRRPRSNGGLLGTLGSLARGAAGQISMAPDLAKIVAGHGLKALGMRSDESPYLFSAPKSIFNDHVSGARLFAVNDISLSDIKSFSKAADATVNDTILAICSGALRRYMQEKEQLPDKSLLATVPVSIQQINRTGNQITYVSARLATDQRDPMRRLDDIRDSTFHAKKEMSEVDPAAATAFAVMAQGMVAVLNRLQLASLLPPPANVVISNVPGPRQPLYFGGARMVANYPLSVLVDGQALNITVVSYCDSVDFGLMACRDTLPDVDKIAAHLDDAFEELKKAAARRQKRLARKKSKAAAAAKLSNGAGGDARANPNA